MSWLAASGGTLAIAGSFFGPAPGDFGLQSSSVTRQWEQSMITLLDRGQPVGTALLIDGTGLFIAHRKAIANPEISAVDIDGKTLQLRLVSVDNLTQLALIAADEFDGRDARAFVAAPPLRTARLMGYAGLQRFQAQLVHSNRVGVDTRTNVLMPLSEIRLEAPNSNVEKALFVNGAHFYGALVSVQNNIAVGGLEPISAASLSQQFGPGPVTIAYITGPDVVRRVLAGFTSEQRAVKYPYLGVVCRTAINGGAEVVTVSRNSPAYEAGIRPGDVIRTIGGAPVGSQIDYGKLMWKQTPGNKIQITYHRQLQLQKTIAEIGNTAY